MKRQPEGVDEEILNEEAELMLENESDYVRHE
jgi:hypothetical protein